MMTRTLAFASLAILLPAAALAQTPAPLSTTITLTQAEALGMIAQLDYSLRGCPSLGTATGVQCASNAIYLANKVTTATTAADAAAPSSPPAAPADPPQ